MNMSQTSMHTMAPSQAPITAEQDSDANARPLKFLRRLVLSLPLMAVAGYCLFGFVATFEPMPRVEQWIWRGAYSGAGAAALIAICWIWLKPRSRRAP
jgi:hypothetical protein